MSLRIKLLATLLACAALNCWAVGTPTPTPTPDPSSTSQASAAAGSTSAAGAAAGSVSGASSNQHQQAISGSNSGGGNVSESSRFGMYVLPAPVFTPPMSKVECPSANIKQRAISIGWSFVSFAESVTDSSDCTLLTLRNMMIEQCRYESAARLEAQLVRKHLPDFPATKQVYLDLNPGECAELKKPVLPPAPVTNNYTTINNPPPACEAVKPRVTTKKAPARAKVCT